MEQDEREVAPPGEAFRHIYEQVISEHQHDKDMNGHSLQKLFDYFTKICNKTTGLLWLTTKSIKDG